ncbi:hypothetical protein [Sphingorhabdus contaminans]|uniref:hypothetical protein n=1 Tax=Sphingorhabdus contaminans TaxID=1343899 RepID=UPI003D29D7F9
MIGINSEARPDFIARLFDRSLVIIPNLENCSLRAAANQANDPFFERLWEYGREATA